MLLQIPVLDHAQVTQCRTILEQASWIDGRVTAGHQSAQVKYNQQLSEHHPVAQKVGDIILTSLEQNPLFISGALPLKIFPPLFNQYGVGEAFGTHIDNAIRSVTGTPHRIRTDLSATLFLSPPEDYDGGELVIEDVFGVQKIKLPAGHLILYPASSLHHVTAVTRGTRLASFFWIQSMIRDDGKRTILFDLDRSIQSITQDMETHPSVVSLTGIYHNLLRQWAEM